MSLIWLHGKELLLFVLACVAVSVAVLAGIGFLIVKLIERKK